MVVLKNILVATDFSEPSTVAMAYGRDLARSYGAALHVLHVVEDMKVQYGAEIGFASPDTQNDFEKMAQRDLDAVITEDDRKTLKLVPVVTSHVNVAHGVADYAAANAIDLIIVGNHGRGAIKKFLTGSVAERVVRTAPCPVLAVRERQREFITPDALLATTVA